MPGNALDSILETSFNRFFLEVMAPETSRHIALAWLDILERGTKDMPTALPVPRQDAFNAKPLVLHVRKEDVAICSAGLNGKDESGEVRQGDDVEIALPREFFNTALGDTIKP